jgi:type I restriction enzyme S subunit
MSNVKGITDIIGIGYTETVDIMPNGWKNLRFDLTCEIINGQVDPKEEKYGLMKHIGNANIEKFNGRLKKVRSAIEDGQISGKYFFDKSDVLYGKINPHFAKVAFPKYKGICSADIYPISSKNNVILPEFLFQVLLSEEFTTYSTSVSGRTGMPKINRDDLNLYHFKLPPLPEQQKIAAILTSVDDVIEKTQAQIDKLKDLKTAMMQELLTKGIGHVEFKDSPVGRIPVGWEVVELENLVSSEKNITYGIVQAGPHFEGGIPYIRVSDMTARHLTLKKMLFTSPAIAEKFKRSAVSKGDIVYALRGMIGHVHMVPAQLDGANLTQGTARISPRETIHANYLLWAMKSPYIAVQNDLEAKGSTFREVTLASLRKIKVCVPTIAEQKRITMILEGIEKKVYAGEDKLNQIKLIKKALMQDLLTGKVRVTSANN